MGSLEATGAKGVILLIKAAGLEGSPRDRLREQFRGHGIGCERCHGPGELHVAARGEEDGTIVNPGRLCAHLDGSWDERRALRATINKSLPALQERSRKTVQIALEVLNKGKTLAVAKAA